MTINTTCSYCEINFANVRASERQDLHQCDECGEVLCAACLQEAAEQWDLEVPEGGLFWCEKAEMSLCPYCWVEPGDE